MIEQTTDKPTHQSPYQSKPSIKQDNLKYIDEALYSDIEGEPLSRFTYGEIQQMRRQQDEKNNKCKADPSMVILDQDIFKQVIHKANMNDN
ncbi:MAG: hypothetical protein EZS28_044931 [Streblomastix strix]|uniref:Uncharacterized protein n=1 Tax=Streblomastix strix TaxID=222440 RepID=A0A5J4TNY6_9EUKA|nr:MAG: hypothetical protein EZS28_044931 [Streblomastix strix]